jgi:CRISPR-associated protein Cas2
VNRRRYLVTYDVSDDGRREKVYRSLLARGDHTQFSVFTCELSDRELARLKSVLSEIVQHEEDQVLIVDLGPAKRDGGRLITAVGRPYLPPIRALVV